MRHRLYLLSALLFALLALPNYAQAQAWLWANHVSGIPPDSLPNVAVTATALTAAGDSYAGYQYASTISLGGQTYQPSGWYDVVLAHHNAAGAVLGALLTGTDAFIAAVRVDTYGNVYAAGRFSGTVQAGAQTLTATLGNSDIFVGKWSATGTLRWLRQGQAVAGDSTDDRPGLAVDGAGRVTVAGAFGASIQFGAQTLTGAGSSPASLFAVQLDSAGQVNWLRAGVSPGLSVFFSDLAAATDGTLYLTGLANTVFEWNGVPVTTGGGVLRFGFWLQLDPNGLPVANRRFTENFQTSFAHVAAGANGGSYIALMTGIGPLNWGNTSIPAPANRCGVIMQLDPTGVPQWTRILNVDSATSYASILTLQTGLSLSSQQPTRLYVGGYVQHVTGSNTSPALTCSGLTLYSSISTPHLDGFALCLDGDTGVPRWLEPAGSGQWVVPYAMGVNGTGQVVMGGAFSVGVLGSSPVNFGSIHLTPTGNGSIAYLAKLTEDFNLTQGTAYTDGNTNAVQDVGESGRAGVVVEQQPGGQFLTTDASGAYSAVAELGTYSYSIPNPPRYYNAVSPAGPVMFSTYNNIAAGHDFALQPIPNQQDIRVFITPVSHARPGFQVQYRITFENVGTVTIANGSVALTFDALLTYLSSTLGGSTQVGNTLAWPYAGLAPGELRSFYVRFQLVPTAPVAASLISTASIAPTTGDLTPADNTETSSLTITGPYDPNDIEVNYPTLPLPQVQAGARPLDYTVRFQNVGTDTAFSISLRDTLPGNLLNLGTLALLTSSHPCTWALGPGGLLTVRFLNIRLPQATANATGSQGFARFRLVPRTTLALGDVIPNRAAIYFDFNPPVTTNTALTTITIPSGVAEPGPRAGLVAWPNPTQGGVLHVRVPKQNRRLTLVDGLGRTVRAQPVAAEEATLDLRGLPAGLYVLRAGGASGRVVVQ